MTIDLDLTTKSNAKKAAKKAAESAVSDVVAAVVEMVQYQVGITAESMGFIVASNTSMIDNILTHFSQYFNSRPDILASCATRVKLVSSIAFDCTQGHEALGILRLPSQTGEFDCLRLLPRPCSAWHPALPESNG